MNVRWKNKWLRALRSGKYEQGKSHLKQENGIPKYCCLGVLCDIHPKVEWDMTEAHFGASHSNTRLPLEFASSLDISGEKMRHLIRMNDRSSGEHPNGQSFNAIADYIEENM